MLRALLAPQRMAPQRMAPQRMAPQRMEHDTSAHSTRPSVTWVMRTLNPPVATRPLPSGDQSTRRTRVGAAADGNGAVICTHVQNSGATSEM